MNLLAELQKDTFENVAEFQVDSPAEIFGFNVRKSSTQQTAIAYNPKTQELIVDRSNSGQVDFKDGFASTYSVPLQPKDVALTKIPSFFLPVTGAAILTL